MNQTFKTLRKMYRYLSCCLLLLFVCCSEPSDKDIEEAFQQVNNEELWRHLEQMCHNDQRYRSLMSGLDKSSVDYQKKRDSLWSLQLEIDKHNTRWIIDFTKKNGFPSPDRTGKPIAAWVLLHHAPSQYHKKIKPLLEREFKAGRISQTTYGLVKWHINGRKGLPEGTGLQIIDNR